MSEKPTEWQVFRFYLRRVALMPGFCFAWAMPLLVVAVFTGNGFAATLIAFIGFVYIPALVLVMYVWKKDRIRTFYKDQLALAALKAQINAELDENTRKALEEKNGTKTD